jgi:hypothetical protein
VAHTYNPTGEAEIRRIAVQGQLGQKSRPSNIGKKISNIGKKGLAERLKW